jgi:hypothetical protein
MRDAVEKLIGDALVECLLGGGNSSGTFQVDETRSSLVIR